MHHKELLHKTKATTPQFHGVVVPVRVPLIPNGLDEDSPNDGAKANDLPSDPGLERSHSCHTTIHPLFAPMTKEVRVRKGEGEGEGKKKKKKKKVPYLVGKASPRSSFTKGETA